MKHIDLYSGIGGFALACDWAGIETICFVEIDDFCQKILRKHWPGVPIVKDVNDVEEIRKVVADTYGQREQQQERIVKNFGRRTLDRNQATADTECGGAKQGYRSARQSLAISRGSLILTAGFPCQPFSVAGRKRGARDNRYLWPHTLKVIEALRPEYVLLENVAGLLGMVFPDSVSQVAIQNSLFSGQDDIESIKTIEEFNTIAGEINRNLEEAGYETLWLVIPACAIGAPHRRDRVWVVGNTKRQRLDGTLRDSESSRRIQQEPEKRHRTIEPWVVAHSPSQQEHSSGEGGLHALPCGPDSHASHASRNGLQGEWTERDDPGSSRLLNRKIPDWHEDWYAAATRLCTLHDGLPGGLARPRGWRVNALKVTGNSIVPQIAYEIIKSIIESNSLVKEILGVKNANS